MKLKKTALMVIAVLVAGLIPLAILVPEATAAPTGTVTLVSDPDNFLTFTTVGVPGQKENVTVTFTNSNTDSVDTVASTIQFVTLAAANLNPTRVSILGTTAYWKIHDPSPSGPNHRADLTGTVTGINEPAPAYYSPYSNSTPVEIWHWNLGSPDGATNLANYTASNQFQSDLRILRPQESLELNVTIQCKGQVGDSRIWFFFRATEFEPSSVPVTALSAIPNTDPVTGGSQRMNIYYQDHAIPNRPVGWWPLHVSYDPYDSNVDSGTGHSFEQVGVGSPLLGWTRIPTTTRFAKTNKMVHQTLVSDGTGEPGPATIHICGTKFNDLNRNGIYDETDPGIDGVTVMLLGADAQTLASQYYVGNFSYPPPENVPPLDMLLSGENGLAGSFCFNLINVLPGTYRFFISIVEPDGTFPTTPTLIGPIDIVVPQPTTPPVAIFSIDHDFGNSEQPPTPVGGVASPTDKLELIAPLLVVLVALAAVVSAVAVSKKLRN